MFDDVKERPVPKEGESAETPLLRDPQEGEPPSTDLAIERGCGEMRGVAGKRLKDSAKRETGGWDTLNPDGGSGRGTGKSRELGAYQTRHVTARSP